MDRAAPPAYARVMTKTDSDPAIRIPPPHHKAHDEPMKQPPRQHETHDAPMKPGRRPGC